ncbi:aminopeptidase O isoform X2 [Astyanax mexicanus]|uniref:aminopeptidase O isoform X2 n=1 Tax=Astyanax mexicanus TaxID=7994 RepID=UPI0020CB5284|nr:aminopeptidase O isoform X2 [Astyanax mexicanus]
MHTVNNINTLEKKTDNPTHSVMQSTQQNDLDPNKDDLPLRANTNHMLVRHYVLDLTVDIQRKVIGGSIVLFLEPGKGAAGLKISEVLQAPDVVGVEKEASCSASATHVPGDAAQERDVCRWSWDDESEDFTLILDCCDLLVSKVEEVDVSNVPELRKLLEGGESDVISSQQLSFILIQKLISIPSHQWRQQQDLYLQCSSAPSVHIQGLLFHMDQWSLQVRKKGVRTPCDFPRILRICYETKSTGGSVRWTKDQDNRCCVYTMGSPINNRALFPCQEPPVAMSTWRARIKAPCEYTVLLSGENQACPMPEETGFFQWDYFVTMPMPASTFTIAVGMWREAREKASNHEEGMNEDEEPSAKLGCRMTCTGSQPTNQSGENQSSPSRLTSSVKEEDEQSFCSHVDYPCRFVNNTSRMQVILPHRVFAPFCHLQKVEASVLPLLPLCLAAAHSVLGVHPFSRLDVLIVPPGFSSLGMASPHIIFLSQSVLVGERGLCGARMCHEIAHSWFGLAIGARDWTEEWISEGFATYLEDVFWAKVQQLDRSEEEEQRQLKAFLRWRRLKDELVNSEEELLVLRPNKDNTGEVSDSGASMVKHALNPGKPFMQVHYLKGYFFLKFLASKVGEEEFLCFFRVFVRKFHGQLILSQDFLQMFLDTFPALSSQGLTLEAVYSDWLDTPRIPKWLEEISSTWALTRPVKEVREEVVKWMLVSGGGGAGKGTKRKRAGPKVNFKELSPEQLVLLLEFLLEEEVLSVSCLSLLQTTYSLRNQDAEVKHRWCELVVKHKYTAAYRDVENFLIHDQAMGVYLYGELMLQEDGRQQALARRCLSAIKDDMDQSARSLVEEMIL